MNGQLCDHNNITYLQILKTPLQQSPFLPFQFFQLDVSYLLTHNQKHSLSIFHQEKCVEHLHSLLWIVSNYQLILLYYIQIHCKIYISRLKWFDISKSSMISYIFLSGTKNQQHFKAIESYLQNFYKPVEIQIHLYAFCCILCISQSVNEAISFHF